MISQQTINDVVSALIPNPTNNLAAKISVMYKFVAEKPKSIKMFTDEQVYGIRKSAKKYKKSINKEVYEEIEKICDYFESILIANKLS